MISLLIAASILVLIGLPSLVVLSVCIAGARADHQEETFASRRLPVPRSRGKVFSPAAREDPGW